MDLSFPRFDKSGFDRPGFDRPGFGRDVIVNALPADLAVLLVDVAARQAGSPTAVNYARMLRGPGDSTLLSPSGGAFNGSVANLVVRWKEE